MAISPKPFKSERRVCAIPTFQRLGGIGAAGVGIGDPGGEEVIGGKQRLLAGPLKDYGDRWGGIESLGGGQQGSLIGERSMAV